MARKESNGSYVVLCAAFAVLIVVSGGLSAFSPQSSMPRSYEVQTAVATQSNIDWHDGSNQSTPQADVTYSEEYMNMSQPINGTMTQMGLLQQYMWIQYNDNTGARVGFELHCVFYPGGINVTEQKVVNWSKLYSIELILHSETWEDNRTVGTMYSFQGFTIIKGNPNSFNLSNGPIQNGSYSHYMNNVIGSISYWSDSARIGNVSLSTDSSNESIATFSVSVNANINNGSSVGSYSANEVGIPIPVVFQFTVTHNLTATEYKYGANIDWSAAKEFPTLIPMAYGENYSLVASDLLMFYVGETNGEVKQFATDASNDTADYAMNNTTMCRELFTKTYTIDNSSQSYNTTRIYVENDSSDQTGNVSKVYVVFGGFTYGNSSSLSFDPAVIIPNSLKSGAGPTNLTSVLPYIVVIAAIAVGAVVVLRFRKK